MNYEVEMVLNHQIGSTHKPKSQIGIESFPRNYWLTHWHCIQVKRLRDNQMIYKAFTKTDKGEVLFIKILKEKCILITSTGEYDIDDVEILNGVNPITETKEPISYLVVIRSGNADEQKIIIAKDTFDLEEKILQRFQDVKWWEIRCNYGTVII